MTNPHRSARARKTPTLNRFYASVLAVAAGNASAAPADAAEPVDEIAGTLRLCTQTPASRLAGAQALRGAAAVKAAAVLPNPSLVLEHQRTLSGGIERETVVGITIPLRLSGRRSLLMDAADARRDQAVLDAGATLLDAALSFREAYVTAAVAQARLSVLEEQQAALDGLSRTLQGLARGGEAAGYDLFRQQTHARLHRHQVETARARARASRAEVEGLLAAQVSLPRPAVSYLAGASHHEDRARDGALAVHPRIRSLQAASRASALEARAASRGWVPDLDVFAGYRGATVATSAGHGISLGLSLPVTLFDHGQGDAALAGAEEKVARGAAESLRTQHDAALKAAHAQLVLLRGSLSELEAATRDAIALPEKARQLYAAGEGTITELLEAFRAAEEARLRLITAAEEIALARLSVMRAMGTQFDAALDRACSGTKGARR